MTDVESAVAEGVMVTTLNRPEQMNTLSTELISELLAAVQRASTDDEVRVMVLTGAGRAFCAGAEVSADPGRAAAGGGDDDKGPVRSRHERLRSRSGSAAVAEAFARCDVPIIGAINGVAAGAGFSLALCCDVRIFAESARIGPIFIKRGLAADYGAAYWLPRIVGAAKAFELFYDGNVIAAGRSLELGLANRVVPDEQLMDEVLAYARQIAAGPPLAYTGIRRLIQDAVSSSDRDRFFDREWAAQAALLASADAREGFRSFLERREPEFHGT